MEGPQRVLQVIACTYSCSPGWKMLSDGMLRRTSGLRQTGLGGKCYKVARNALDVRVCCKCNVLVRNPVATLVDRPVAGQLLFDNASYQALVYCDTVGKLL